MNKKEYCERIGVPVVWYDTINSILSSNGFNNWHLREEHAIPEILHFIKKLQGTKIVTLMQEDKCSICGAPLKGFIYYEKNGFKICRFCYKDLQMKEG